MSDGKTRNGRAVSDFFSRPAPPAVPPAQPQPSILGATVLIAAQIVNAALMVTCMMVAGVVVVPGLFQLSAKVSQLEKEVDSKSQAVAERELLLEASRKQTVIQQGQAIAAAETANRLAAENVRLAEKLAKSLKDEKDR